MKMTQKRSKNVEIHGSAENSHPVYLKVLDLLSLLCFKSNKTDVHHVQSNLLWLYYLKFSSNFPHQGVILIHQFNGKIMIFQSAFVKIKVSLSSKL